MRAINRLIASLLPLALLPLGGASTTADLEQGPPSPALPIKIVGDDQLATSPATSAGTGTPEDPFIIERFLVAGSGYPDGSAGIHIEATTKHLEIRHNHVVASLFGDLGIGCGILIKQASNVTATENDVRVSNHGICILGSEQVHVDANVISGYANLPAVVTVGGILVSQTSNQVLVVGNTISGFANGISVQGGSAHVQVVGNDVRNIGVFGALEGANAANVTFSNNLVEGVEGSGIQILSAVDVEAAGNTIRDASTAVWVDESFVDGAAAIRATFRENLIATNGVALHVVCDDCTLSGNQFMDNDELGLLEGVGQAVRLNDNSFVGNGAGFDEITGTVSARFNNFESQIIPFATSSTHQDWRHNWWGSAEGPAPGAVVGPIQTEPWAMESF